jgi:hypothetical protein
MFAHGPGFFYPLQVFDELLCSGRKGTRTPDLLCVRESRGLSIMSNPYRKNRIRLSANGVQLIRITNDDPTEGSFCFDTYQGGHAIVSSLRIWELAE